MNEFRERRMKDDRGCTPREVLKNVLKNVDEIDEIYIVYQKDGYTEIDYCSDDPIKLIGLIETGKQTMINCWYEEE